MAIIEKGSTGQVANYRIKVITVLLKLGNFET